MMANEDDDEEEEEEEDMRAWSMEHQRIGHEFTVTSKAEGAFKWLLLSN
jgi:hypothetical protein